MAKKQSFEERLERLEEIVEELRTGDIGLDQALSVFEEGMQLSKGLEKELEKVERRVEILMNEPEDPEDTPELELFPGSEG
ncbi:MAG: exodeoxyribonuclease VII small subunit [Spirochaetota bacterium]